MNFNIDDVMGFEGNKLLINRGNKEIKRYTINDTLIGAIGYKKSDI